jgi:hypothetical protein
VQRIFPKVSTFVKIVAKERGILVPRRDVPISFQDERAPRSEVKDENFKMISNFSLLTSEF